jgi:hypothetical protein
MNLEPDPSEMLSIPPTPSSRTALTVEHLPQDAKWVLTSNGAALSVCAKKPAKVLPKMRGKQLPKSYRIPATL